MDAVRLNIAGILSLTDDIMICLLHRLEALGVCSIPDPVDVRLEDIILDSLHPYGILLPIPARGLH